MVLAHLQKRKSTFHTFPNLPNGRPIVSGCGSLTEKISQFVDAHAKHLVPKLPSLLGPNQILTQWFYCPIAMKPKAMLKVLRLKALFPLVPTGYQWLVGKKCLKYVTQ